MHTRLAAVFTIAIASSHAPVSAQQDCTTPVGAYCSNAQSSLCCPSATSYCQPWNANYYQCLAVSAGCSDFETDVDYADNDIGSYSKVLRGTDVSNVSPDDCCAICQGAPGCRYFTFVNLDPAGPVCYLKSAKSGSVRKVDAVSGRVLSPMPLPTPTRTPDACSYPKGAECKLPVLPRNWDFNYRCTVLPEICGAVATDVDYDEDAVGKEFDLPITKCAEKCRATAGCNFYTFTTFNVVKSNNMNTDWSVCNLKSTRTSGVLKYGVYSGNINSEVSTPTPIPSPRPTPAITPMTSPSPQPTAACATPVGEYCGNGNGVTACCPPSSYCQPWDKYYYQCLATPEGCGEYETDVDYFPWECCTKRKETAGYNFFSFVSAYPLGPTCYLKSNKTGSVRKVGVVSGSSHVVAASVPTPEPLTPTPTPTTTLSGDEKCGAISKSTGFTGCDIKEVLISGGSTSGDCCALCANTKGCKAYSFHIYYNAKVRRCVLKSGVCGKALLRSEDYGVVSAEVTSPLLLAHLVPATYIEDGG